MGPKDALFLNGAGMGDRLEHLFQEWHKLGGAVLVSRVIPDLPTRRPEEVIAESTAYCRESSRLTWVVLDWLIKHIEEIDARDLIRLTRERGDLSVLGLLCDAARQRRRHPKFDRIIAACTPNKKLEPFFRRVARSPLALKLTQENSLEIFRRWNYLCNELTYLSEKGSSSSE